MAIRKFDKPQPFEQHDASTQAICRMAVAMSHKVDKDWADVALPDMAAILFISGLMKMAIARMPGVTLEDFVAQANAMMTDEEMIEAQSANKS